MQTLITMSESPIHLIFFTLLLSTQVVVNHGCGLPPSVWCSSFEAAKRCQVIEQCATLSSWGAKPVNLTLFYESLCPDCQRFFATQLKPTWDLLADTGIFHLELVPFGNAEESWDKDHWHFDCQHGPDECAGNVIEGSNTNKPALGQIIAWRRIGDEPLSEPIVIYFTDSNIRHSAMTCAIDKIKDMKTLMPFLECMEASEVKPNKSGPSCAQKHKIDYGPIHKCAGGLEGNGLEHEMAVRTAQLSPAHNYVPWVTVNGIHTEAIQNEAETNLLKLICDTYQGPKPSACSSSVRACHRNTPKKPLVPSGGADFNHIRL